MVYLNSLPKKTVIALIISQSILSSTAFAAGFQINEISPRLQGDATAGAAAATNDATSMFINPATLATLEENQGSLGVSAILPNIGMSNASAIHTINVPGTPATPITAVVLGKNYENNISPSVYVPNGYAGWRLSDQWVAGLALVAPFGLRTNYAEDSVVRFVALYDSVQTFDINPNLAYKFNDMWSVGAGFQAQYLLATFSNNNGPYLGIPIVDALNAASYPTHLKAEDWGYGFNVGVLFRPQPSTRVGLGYRSQITQDVKGTGQQYTGPGAVVPAPSQNFPFNAQTHVLASVTTPQIVTLSGAQDINNWTLKASLQLNFWSVFKQLTINLPDAYAYSFTLPTKWQNSWFGSLGGEYHFTNLWSLRAGLAYDQTPTKDAYRDPRIPDANRVWATFGSSYVWNKNLAIDFAYEHIFMENQTVNTTQATGASATSTLPLEVNTVYANYSGSADILALALRYSFN